MDEQEKAYKAKISALEKRIKALEDEVKKLKAIHGHPWLSVAPVSSGAFSGRTAAFFDPIFWIFLDENIRKNDESCGAMP